jgi:hypothetical protein
MELEYRRAFDEFARVVARVQTQAAQQDGDRQAIQAARVELEQARVAYIQARDAWARHLLRSSATDVEPESVAVA